MSEKEELTKEEAVEQWKEYVRDEVNTYLDSFLEIADKGTIGVKYAFADLNTYEDGSSDPDHKEANGVQLTLVFEFEKPLYFTNEDGFVE